MNRLVTLAVVSAIALAACSSSETTSTGTVPAVSVTFPDTSTTTSAPQIPQTTASAADTSALPATGTVTEDDLVRFVAATESVLNGTANQGIVYDAPEIYIAIAQTACARFSAGDTFEQVSNDLLTELATTSPADDNRLVGAILGAATQTICPEHAT